MRKESRNNMRNIRLSVYHSLIAFNLVLVGLFIIAGLIGGCGNTYWDETIYSNPNWTPEGLVYCTKTVHHHKKYGLGNNEYLGTDYSYVTMDTDGNNETSLPYNSYPYFSPKGTYVALITLEGSSNSNVAMNNGNTISIIRRSDNAKVYEFSPTTESISMLDWGPDEDKLVYLKNHGDINIIKTNGSQDFNIAISGESVSWKYGDNIAFQYLDGLYTPLAIIRYDGVSRINISTEGVSSPCISNIETNKIYGDHATEYGHTDINQTPPKYNKLFDTFNGSNPMANFNNNKIVYSNYGGGVWIINIDGTNIKQLK